jgi:hypothetical protein
MLKYGDVLRENVSAHPEFKPYASFPGNRNVAQALRPWPQYTGVEEAYPYNTNTFYNGMQVTGTRRFSNGIGILAAYTFSKTIGYTDSNGPMGSGDAQDVYNRGLERSLASYSIPHDLKLTWIYEIPVGKGKKFDLGAVNYVLGGWKFSGIQRYNSGFPVAVSQSGVNAGLIGSGTVRPDVTGSAQTLGGATSDLDYVYGTPYLSPAGFAPSPRTAAGTPIRLGTAPRFLPNVRAPHSSSEDMSMSKTFPIYERLTFQVGAAFINVLNRHGRGFMTTDVTSANFGKLVASGGSQRSVEIEARIEW